MIPPKAPRVPQVLPESPRVPGRENALYSSGSKDFVAGATKPTTPEVSYLQQIRVGDVRAITGFPCGTVDGKKDRGKHVSALSFRYLAVFFNEFWVVNHLGGPILAPHGVPWVPRPLGIIDISNSLKNTAREQSDRARTF